MNENSPNRQGTDPMEVINQRIDNARFDGEIETVEHYKNMADDMTSYLQERPLRKVNKGDQLYDQTHGQSLEELSRDELVAKWAESEDAGDLTQSSDVQDEIERRLESEKNMSDDLKMRMIDRLYSQKEELKKSNTEETQDQDTEKEIEQTVLTDPNNGQIYINSAIGEEPVEKQDNITAPLTPPVFTGVFPETQSIERADDEIWEEDEWFIPESDINNGLPRPYDHPSIAPPIDFPRAEVIEAPQSSEQLESREVIDSRSFKEKVKDAKARVFAAVTTGLMKTKDFFKESDQDGNEKIDRKRVTAAAGIGVIALAATGYLAYRYGLDRPRGGGNAIDTMDSGQRPKVGVNGTEGAVQINPPKDPSVLSVPNEGEIAMPAPKPSVNLDQAPWNVAHELAPGDEMSKINETIEKFNSFTGSQLSLNRVGETVQIYSGNRAITPAQQQFFNEMLLQNL